VPPQRAEADLAAQERVHDDGARRHHVKGAGGGWEVGEHQPREDVIQAVGDEQQRDGEAGDGVVAVGAGGH
jgi:hypothetical protein